MKGSFDDFEQLLGTLEKHDLWLVYRKSVGLGVKLLIEQSPRGEA